VCVQFVHRRYRKIVLLFTQYTIHNAGDRHGTLHEEPGEQCTVVFVLTVTEPAIECVCRGGCYPGTREPYLFALAEPEPECITVTVPNPVPDRIWIRIQHKME
jgi:hypothetical protein